MDPINAPRIRACILFALVCWHAHAKAADPGAHPYAAGSALNARGDGGAPPGPVGALWLIGGQHNIAISNRQVWLINPYATEAERTNPNQPAYKDWNEAFLRRVDVVTAWLEATKTPTVAIHDFERWAGNTGDNQRFLAVDEALLSASFQKTWLVDGLLEPNVRLYAAAGRQVILHSGCPDSASYAAGYIRTATPEARGELIDNLNAVFTPLVKTGGGVGLDNAADQPIDSITYARACELRLIGCYVQIEATPAIAATHWHAWPCRISYALFKARHLEPQEPWAAGKFAKFPSDQFKAISPDCRVSIFPGDLPAPSRIDGTEADKRALFEDLKKLTRPIVAGGARVLLHERLCVEAAKLKITVSELLP